MESTTPDVYEELRPLLFSIAYRMLASVTDAEDVVQEAFLRYHRARSEGQEIESPKAFLLLLERLSPVERAVFLLRDVFGYGFDEVAAIVEKSEANCRQLVSRARRHISEDRPRFETSLAARDQLARRFFAAVGDGDMGELVGVLAADVVVYGDSGGRPPSWPRPIVGADNVSRLMFGLGVQMRQVSVEIRQRRSTASPALWSSTPTAA